jgi:hypothetical protein
MAGRILPGNFERGRGVTLASQFREMKPRLILAEENSTFIPLIRMASGFGNLFWHLNLAVSYRW